jgi:hypothetical protein
MDDGQDNEERQQRIREIAYFLWQEEGCPPDRAEHHWMTAETVVDGQDEKRETDGSGTFAEPLASAAEEPMESSAEAPETAPEIAPTPFISQTRAPRAARR